MVLAAAVLGLFGLFLASNNRTLRGQGGGVELAL
jgi:hypothetical protein